MRFSISSKTKIKKKGQSAISRIKPSLILRLGSGLKIWKKNLLSRINLRQNAIAKLIKRHRTVKILHIFRNYSALAVVISSSILVTSTNIVAGKESSGFLFGEYKEEIVGVAQKDKIKEEANQKDNLILAPIVKASTAVDIAAEQEEKKNEVIISNLDLNNQKSLAFVSPFIQKDPEEEGGVKVYTVQEGDTVSTIAQVHDITTNTILWANDISDPDSIMPGDKIFILPIAGLSHKIKTGDTIESIAKEYKADKEKIIAFNDLPANGEITAGEEIVIPDGQKEVPQRTTATTLARRQYATPGGGMPAVSGWKKLEGKAGTGHRFPYGYCTWYVSQKRYVPWGGNAGTWLYHAKTKGYKTGKKPKKGAIVVTTDNSYYGHVAIVEKVKSGSIVISEMNFKGWGKVNSRTISTKSRTIRGYIY